MLQSSAWITGSTFFNNSANGVGGAFRAHIAGAGVHLDNCDLIQNDAPNGGGVIDLEQAGRAFLNRSRFLGNTSVKGGAIRMQTESTATITDCYFSKNEANAGGVVYLMYRANVNLYNVTMEVNKANYEGGAIYCR
jgi:predicted outer membrane repeat protein